MRVRSAPVRSVFSRIASLRFAPRRSALARL
jgi:hypothetical protein